MCCSDATLAKDGVQEEISIAKDLEKELDDPRFIIPLRRKPFKKIFGIGELQWIDFVGSWASGLNNLLDAFEKQNVPRTMVAKINPNWENYRKRLAIKVENTPEVLTSNWLRVASLPDTIRYFSPPGAINHELMKQACRKSTVSAENYSRGFFSFASLEEINRHFADVATFEIQSEQNPLHLLYYGSMNPIIQRRAAQNLISSLFRRAWENFCRSKNLFEYPFALQKAFHVGEAQMPLGKKVSWSRHGQHRSSMLRNISGGRVWQYR